MREIPNAKKKYPRVWTSAEWGTVQAVTFTGEETYGRTNLTCFMIREGTRSHAYNEYSRDIDHQHPRGKP